MSTRQRVEEIFHKVIEHSPADRAQLVRSLCGGDAALCGEVEALLVADADSKSVPRPASASVGASRAETVASPKTIGEEPGDVVGSYKLLQKLGEGGFGTVWVAEQRAPVRRKVALKILKAGLDTGDVLARFEAERQALAMMDHPHVAKVYDAGATEMGRPYFVMEHVPGLSITEYCDTGKLRIRQRLELLIPVCQAVQHAHQKGIIHRDLKPGNIMVTLHDGKPVPKVIDFGIAKATIGHLTDRTLYTVTGRMMGTPEYMSPEQAGTSGLDVDTRTDVYSLGVILYELLTGTLPFDPKTLRSAGLDGMAKIIKEMEPPRPSTRLGTLATEAVNRKTGETPEEIGKRHGMAFNDLRRELHGDLDWIVMKCLEKDRARRYETPNSLALDIQRHLDGEPVVAAPPSAAYKLRKFVRRHKVGVLAGVGIAAVLVLGIFGTTVGMVRAIHAEREQSALRAQAEAARDAATLAEANALEQAEAAQVARAEAQKEADNAKAVTDFFQTMLASVNPEEEAPIPTTPTEERLARRRSPLDWFVTTRGGAVDVTVLDLLNRTIPQIESATKGRPAVEAVIRETIGRTLMGLGVPQPFGEQLKKAIDAYKIAYGEEHPLTLRAQVRLAERWGSSLMREEILVPLIPLLEKNLGSEDRDTLGAKVLLTEAIGNQHGTYRAFVGEFEAAAATIERLYGPADWFTLHAQCLLAIALVDGGRTDEAVTIARPLLDRVQRHYGSDHNYTLQARRRLGELLSRAERFEESLAVAEENYKECTRVLGAHTGPARYARGARVTLLLRLGRVDEAVVTAEKDLATDDAAGLGANDKVLHDRLSLSVTFADRGEIHQACNIITDVLRRAYPQPSEALDWDGIVGHTRWNLGQPRYRASIECLVEPVDAIATQAQSEFSPDRRERYGLLGLAAYLNAQTGRCERAVAQAREAYENTDRLLGEKDDSTRAALSNLSDVLGECGDIVAVLPYYSSLLDKLAQGCVDDPKRLSDYYNGAAWQTRKSANYHTSGLEWARKGYELALNEYGENKFETLGRMDTLAWLLHLNDREAEAETLKRGEVDRRDRFYPNRRYNNQLHRLRLAHILAAQGKTGEAKQILSKACEELQSIFKDESDWLSDAINLLIQLLEADGENAQADKWRAALAKAKNP